jgi:hypothetical protein
MALKSHSEQAASVNRHSGFLGFEPESRWYYQHFVFFIWWHTCLIAGPVQQVGAFCCETCAPCAQAKIFCQKESSETKNIYIFVQTINSKTLITHFSLSNFSVTNSPIQTSESLSGPGRKQGVGWAHCDLLQGLPQFHETFIQVNSLPALSLALGLTHDSDST